MTVCNINFATDSVALYSDTLVYRGDKPIRLCSRKVEVSPCGRFMWATRGSVALGDAYDEIAAYAGDVDIAASVARHWLERLTAADLERHGVDAQDVFVAGWSDVAGDLVVFDMRRRKAPGVEVTRLDRGIYLNPSVRDRAPALPPTATPRQMIAIAHAQQRFDRELDTGFCIGGVLHETVATRHGVVQRIADLYGDHDRHAAEFGDPNADEVAAFLAAWAALAA